MRVIRRGVIPQMQTHEVTCMHCKSDLEFHELEALRITDLREGDYFQLTCPVCHGLIAKAVKP